MGYETKVILTSIHEFVLKGAEDLDDVARYVEALANCEGMILNPGTPKHSKSDEAKSSGE